MMINPHVPRHLKLRFTKSAHSEDGKTDCEQALRAVQVILDAVDEPRLISSRGAT